LLERDRLMPLDFDPLVSGMASQPKAVSVFSEHPN
jgi:hypothetical protein